MLCIDATLFITVIGVGELQTLGDACGTAVISGIVRREILRGGRAESLEIASCPWLAEHRATETEDLKVIKDLHVAWGSTPPKNDGEAEVIALCERHGWVAVLDDREALQEARHRNIPALRGESLILLLVALGRLDESQGWTLQRAVADRTRHATLQPARKGDWDAALHEVREATTAHAGLDPSDVARIHSVSIEAIVERYSR